MVPDTLTQLVDKHNSSGNFQPEAEWIDSLAFSHHYIVAHVLLVIDKKSLQNIDKTLETRKMNIVLSKTYPEEK
jgi:hypothetical protein